jgi:DNA-binding LacI/PurR family transcriptional regulator
VSIGSSNYGPANTLIGIEAAARADGYSVSFVNLDRVDRSSMKGALDHLTGAGVDGVVVLSPTRSAVEAVTGVFADVPVVTVEGFVGDERPAVVIDQVRGGRVATAHLLALGHPTVHHVRGPGDWLEAEARVHGWRSELQAHGRPVPECLTGDWSAASGYDAGRRLALLPDVSAVFVANDQMAIGVVRALSEAGRRVPEDISVVGFDDIPEAAYLRPPLTTVRQDFAELGRRCVRQLLGLVEGSPTAVATTIEPELVVRASTAPPTAD